MALTLLVATYQNLPPSRPMSKLFGPSGGTIGRAPNNDLILPDPMQYVSRLQARIACRGEAYFLVVQGRNPILLNGKPLRNGEEHELADGDRLMIGDYGVTVKIGANREAKADVLGWSRPADSSSTLSGTLGPSELYESVRPVGEGVRAFGIDLGGGGLGPKEARGEPMFDGANQLLPSGTQRDHLPDIYAPLPPARPKLDSSLLDDLDADVSTPQAQAASLTPSGGMTAHSGERAAIPDDFNPFTNPGVRKSGPVRQPMQPSAEPDRTALPQKVAPIPDDFDPFAGEPARRSEEPVTRPSEPRDAGLPAQPPKAGGAAGSLLEGLDAASSGRPTRPAQAEPGVVIPGRSPDTGGKAGAETVPTEKPAAAALQAARGQLQLDPATSAEEALAVGYTRALRELLAGADVPELTERMMTAAQPLQKVGQLLRMVIVGLQRALEARRIIKHELRVDMTMVHQRRNNPLKFAPDASEALAHLLTPKGGGAYLTPEEAIIEAFEDLQAHHLAVMAGVRAALQSMLRRYDRAELERQLNPHPLLDKILPMNRKARLWDLLTNVHDQIKRESEDEFDRLFGQHFRVAYEEQIGQLRRMRKAK